ncbi:MAG: DUF1842 domain-containing protein [Acidobacteriota bacterium]
MSANDAVYLVKLKFESDGFGGGSMTAQLAVDPVHRTFSGRADGDFEEGTARPPRFTATFAGSIHSTGLGDVTQVGAADGQALVSFTSPPGSYLTRFAMGFGVDNDWNGRGSFTVGDQSYECKITAIG